MMAVLITSPDEKKGEELAGEITRRVREVTCAGKTDAAQPSGSPAVKIIGPAKASIGKINDVYRFVIYCKSADYRQLTVIKDKIEQYA